MIWYGCKRCNITVSIHYTSAGVGNVWLASQVWLFTSAGVGNVWLASQVWLFWWLLLEQFLKIIDSIIFKNCCARNFKREKGKEKGKEKVQKRLVLNNIENQTFLYFFFSLFWLDDYIVLFPWHNSANTRWPRLTLHETTFFCVLDWGLIVCFFACTANLWEHSNSLITVLMLILEAKIVRIGIYCRRPEFLYFSFKLLMTFGMQFSSHFFGVVSSVPVALGPVTRSSFFLTESATMFFRYVGWIPPDLPDYY